MGHAMHKAKARKSGVSFCAIGCGFLTLLLFSLLPAATLPTQPGANTIVQRSVEALRSDWQAEPRYDYLERDVKNHESRTSRVMMILGSPYRRLEAVNGMPLSPEDQQEEQRKLNAAVAERCGESTLQTRKRIENYNRGRERDHFLMSEMTKALVFNVLDETTINGRNAWHLQASPKPGYTPPNREAKVLTGMKGELWIDKSTFEWIQVVAQVIHPVSIEGFLARVEPGTRFKLVRTPVAGGPWFPIQFSDESKVRVLSFFGRNGGDDETYSDYQTADSVSIPPCPGGGSKDVRSKTPGH
jgi:hypothetical protein